MMVKDNMLNYLGEKKKINLLKCGNSFKSASFLFDFKM